MVKVLRKYNKYILVVGGSLLMIAFLMPQAVNQLFGDPGKQVYAHLGSTKLTRKDFAVYERDYQAVEKFMPSLTRGTLGIENSSHWMLLVKEAEAGGFIGDAGDGIDWPMLQVTLARAIAEDQFKQMASYVLQMPQYQQQFMQQAKQIMPALKNRAMGEGRLTENEFNAALAKARGIYRMMEAFQQAARLSDARAIAAKQERLDRSVGDALVIPADRFVPGVADPTEAELQDHFARYRELTPAAGEFGIGYRLPQRVKLEWLALDRTVIGKAIEIDPIEANKRWRANRAKFVGEFAAEQPKVEEEIRKEKVDQIVSEADKLVRNELKKAVSKLEGDKGFRKLPGDWAATRPKLEDVASMVARTVRESSGTNMVLPTVTVKAAKWLTQSDLQRLDQIGQSSMRVGTKSVPFVQVIFSAKELRQSDSGLPDLGVQQMVTSGEAVLTDDAGNRFYFTILDSRAESAADSIEDVRDLVVENVKKIKAFEVSKGELGRYRGIAGTDGLDKLAQLIDAEHPAAVPPTPTEGPEAGKTPPAPKLAVERRVEFFKGNTQGGDPALDNPELRDAVTKIASTLDPLKTADQATAAARTVAQPIAKKLSLAVVQVLARRPGTVEELRQSGDGPVQELQMAEMRRAFGDDRGSFPFAYQVLMKRHDLRLEKNNEDGSPDSAPTPPVKKAGA